jgi:class 3 adenylate cyclase
MMCEGAMSEIRKIAAILVTDVVGSSRLAGADENRTLSRLRGLRSDLIDPAIDAHHGRIVKRTGDGCRPTGKERIIQTTMILGCLRFSVGRRGSAVHLWAVRSPVGALSEARSSSAPSTT